VDALRTKKAYKISMDIPLDIMFILLLISKEISTWSVNYFRLRGKHIRYKNVKLFLGILRVIKSKKYPWNK
jgi:hypothetical protein